MRTKLLFVILVFLLSASSCRDSVRANRVVVIQPFWGFSDSEAKAILSRLKPLHKYVILRSPISLPRTAFYRPRSRYRADSLLHLLKSFGSADTVIIGLTEKDISTTKGQVSDWGIMGLGFQPGRACVFSSFRLHKAALQDQFYKVAIHELGHTQGLPHCKVPWCYMRDAQGGNPLSEEKDFCTSCKSFLTDRGWKLN